MRSANSCSRFWLPRARSQFARQFPLPRHGHQFLLAGFPFALAAFRYGYPPDKQQWISQTVLEQAKVLSAYGRLDADRGTHTGAPSSVELSVRR